ncbi:DUF7601 domain-containing protein [Faecalimonas sp.]
MKIRKVKFLSMLLVMVMIINMLPLSVFAKDVYDQNILGVGTQSENKYLDYMSRKNSKEHVLRFNKMSLTNYWMTKDDNQTKYVVFCFNEKKSAPNRTMYLKKFENGTENEFASLAADPIKGRLGSTYVRNSVMWATYLGYPGNKGVCNNQSFIDRAIDFYHIPDEYAEDAVRLATQMAVWLFTDYNTALDKFWSPIKADGSLGKGNWDRIKICDKYDTSMGDPITYLAADIAYQAYDNSGDAPKDMVLDLYIPKSEEYRDYKQNLLVTYYKEMKIERKPVKVTLDVQKKMDNGRKVTDKEFSFDFVGRDSKQDYNQKVYNNSNGKIMIPELTFTEPGKYQFYIQENKGNNPDVEYETSKFPITVTVEGVRDLKTRVSYGEQGKDQLVITNKVKLPQLGQLRIGKTVAGEGADSSKQFDFTVTLKDAQGNLVSGNFGGYTFSKGIANVKVSQNKPVTITDIPAGITYTVTENLLPENSDYTLTSSNNLTGTIRENNVAEAEFLNTTKPIQLYGKLKISKVVKGVPSGQKIDKFTFTVKLDNPKADVSKVTGATFKNGEATVSVAAGGSIIITGLPAGVGYTVTERTLDGYAVTSTGSTGYIVANQQKDVNFVNTYLNTGELTVQKVIEGSGASDADVFKFKLTLSNDEGLLTNKTCIVKFEDGSKVTKQIVNGELEFAIKGSGFATITDLPVGVHYQVAEKQADGSFTSTQDNIVENGYKLTSVTGNGQTTIAEKTMKVVFTNTKHLQKGYLQIFKAIEGSKSDKNDEFGFRITLKNKSGVPLSGTYLNQDGEKINFDSSGVAVVATKGGKGSILPSVRIKDLPVGTRYSVEEFTGVPGEYTAIAGNVVKDGYVLKKIIGKASGTIGVGKNSMTFLNRKADTSLTIQKKIAGDHWTDDIFTFSIRLLGNGARFNGVRDGVTFKNGYAEVNIQGAGTKMITGIPESNYTIAEKPVKGWNIPKQQSGTLTDGIPKTVVFENVKEKIAPAVVSLQARKLFDGQVPAEGEFTFILKDGNGKTIDIKNNGVDGKILFDSIPIQEIGVYTYNISEEPGNSELISYDSTVYTAVVRVTKDERSHSLKAEVTYQKNEGEVVSELVFENKTIIPETTSVKVEKKWNLDDGGTATSYVTVALLKDGVRYETIELSEQNGWTYTWENLSKDNVWTVEEVDVPEGFQSSVEKKNKTFVIINDDIPEKPTKPEKPEELEKPTKPEKANTSMKKEEPRKERVSVTRVSVPKTNDMSHVYMWMVMSMVSLSGVGIVLLRIKKRKRN